MRYFVAALFAVLLLAGCGGSSTESGPEATVEGWVEAFAAHDFAAACALETVEYQGEDCAATYAENVGYYQENATEGMKVASDGTENSDGSFSFLVELPELSVTASVTVREVDGEWLVADVQEA